MSSTSNVSLQELLLSAESPEDLIALEQLLAEQQSKPQTKWIAGTLSEVAEFFGLAVQTVKQWRMESPPMPGREGAYPLDEIVRWRHAKLSQSDVKTAKQRIELELSEIEVERRRLALAQDKGQLLDRADVELWASVALIEAREMVMSLPEMLATSVQPEVREFVRTEADRHCRDVLVMLRRKLEADEIAGDKTSGTAATGEVVGLASGQRDDARRN